MSAKTLILFTLPLAFLAGCGPKDEGFTLPAGDAERGKSAFISFRCFDCHEVHNVDLPAGEEPNQKMVELGGVVTRTQSYADLVTGIINPSHRLAKGYEAGTNADNGESPMKVYNDVMTVSELVDIVTFLQAHYELLPYEPTDYPYYYGP
jgi:hypothetical protein